MGVKIALFVLLVQLLSFWKECSGSFPSDPTYYPVDTNLVYTWTRGYPQGCDCAQGGVKKESCDLFRCPCICDVTAGMCDYNCCCDVDCSSDQKSRFSSLDACASEGVEITSIQHCYSSVELYGVNPREPLGGQPTAHDAVGQALCVVQKNTAIPEEFFESADVVASSVFTTSDGQKTYSYLASEVSTLAVDANYDQNDSIAAFLDTIAEGLVTNGPGYLQLPLADFTGACNDQNYVTFENPVEPKSCARTLSTDSATFAAQCETQFSLSRYVTDLYIATQANSVAANGVTTAADVLGIQLDAVFFEDYLSGSMTDITADWGAGTCATKSYTGSPSLDEAGTVVDAACSFSDASTLTDLRNSATLCQGFVKAVYYTVHHDTTTEAPILLINATVTLSDVPLTDSLVANSSTGGAAVTVTQTFGVRFASADGSEKSTDNGNLVQRHRSGNPGYLLGMPVLYGALATTVIDELVDGFTVPSAIAPYDSNNPETFGLNICPQSSSYTSASGVAAGSAQVKFGYDLTSGCSVRLNRTELINLCCAGSGTCSGVVGQGYYSKFSDVSTGIPYFYNLVAGYVGNYGDADPLDVTQWSELTYSAPSDTRTWNEKTATCSNMFNGLEIQFLVASTGSRSNPQSKIISSVAQITTGDWVMKVPADDAYSKQTFPLTITVSFVFQNEVELRDFVTPAPPVLFKVPYDVFYPFLSAAPIRYSQRMMLFGHWSVSISIIVSAVCAVMLMM